MPMLDDAAPQAADADEELLSKRTAPASGIALGLAQYGSTAYCIFDTGSAVDSGPRG